MAETLTVSSATVVTVPWPCDGQTAGACVWREMHHLDDDGRHWCPTGYMLCHEHDGVGTIDGPDACQLWDQHPDGEAAGG